MNLTLDEIQKWRVPVGTTIICPHCSLYVGKVVKEIRHGSPLTSQHFAGPGIRQGGYTNCVDCGMPWFLPELGKIHSSRGWVPDPIVIVPA